jgi:hypothetical protein
MEGKDAVDRAVCDAVYWDVDMAVHLAMDSTVNLIVYWVVERVVDRGVVVGGAVYGSIPTCWGSWGGEV